MVQKITVQNNQSLIDIAIKDGRTAEAVLDLMQQTGLSITAMLEPGYLVEFDITGKRYETTPNAFRGVFVPGSLSVAVRNNQNLMDIAIQEAGTVEAVLDLMKLNGQPITEVMNTGHQLSFVMDDKYLTDTQSYYKGKNLHPATGNTQTEAVEYLEGIGYWTIQQDFRVS